MDEMFAGYLITTGCVRYRDLAYVIGVEAVTQGDEQPRSRVFIRDRDRWIPPIDLAWNARSCTIAHSPDERLVAISEEGYVLAAGGGQVVVEPRIAPGAETPGPLTEVRSIDGTAYAIGTLRQVYLRESPGVWKRIDQTCRATGPNATEHGFRAIDGFSPSDIYAAGWGGELWHFDGSRWAPCPTITAFDLSCLRCGGDGLVYAAGQQGVVLRGRGDQWEVIEHHATTDDIWGCEWFQDRLFLSTLRAVYELSTAGVKPTGFGPSPAPASCYQLTAADGVLWSIGATDITEFDGTNWRRVL